jgi:hypothetical protein
MRPRDLRISRRDELIFYIYLNFFIELCFFPGMLACPRIWVRVRASHGALRCCS